ncbi:MAG: SPASM domain-containing protein, partial [Vicinamibacteria bacterium]|nr:SPASM domain-containing protein [Vicinamibacteria bacterium]
VAALREKCLARGIRFDMRPKVVTELVDNYYQPGSRLNGRCLYPFNWARVSFSGKVYFCPFIRVEVGDLTTQTLEEVWNGAPYVDLRQRLLKEQLFPVCRRCCKVELSPLPVPREEGAVVRTRAIPLTVVR